jgi:hypothetical protein
MSITWKKTARAAESPVKMLRSSKTGSFVFPELPAEYTRWIKEQRAWRETCALSDQSYHVTDVYVTLTFSAKGRSLSVDSRSGRPYWSAGE